MKKYPRWAFVVAGVVVTLVALYAWGRYNMKKKEKAAADAKGTGAPAVQPSTATKLAGPVIRLS